jgi:TM2 domain-containing membrane protein YozV
VQTLSSSSTAKKRGDPTVAALLTWFLPGAGHMYLGQFGLGLALLVVVNGIYWLGLELSHGMAFEFLDAELRTSLGPILAPEVGNLGGMMWQMKKFGFGTGLPRLWPEWIVLGSTLTATSGVLNTLVMCHAHTLARTDSPRAAARPVLAALMTWFVPGLGHVLQGRAKRGLVVFVLLVSLFVVGSLLADGSNLSRERHFYYWAGQFLIGLPGIAAEALFGSMRVTRDIAYVEAGLVFGCVAGMLNVLAMLDVYGYGEARILGRPLFASAPATPASGATAAPRPADEPLASAETSSGASIR